MARRTGPDDDELPTLVDPGALGELQAVRSEFRAALARDQVTARGRAGPGTARGRAEPGTARGRAEPGTARGRAEPGTARGRAEPGTARGRAEPGTARGRAETPSSEIFPEEMLPTAVRTRSMPETPAPPPRARPAPPAAMVHGTRNSLPPSLDLAEALGVSGSPRAPSPTPERAPPPEPSAEAIDVSRFLGHAPREKKPRKKAHRRPSILGAAQLQNLGQTSEAWAKVLPAILGVMVLLSTAFVFVSLFGGPRTSDHVRLELLAAAGLPGPTAGLGSTHLIIRTDPEGVLVFYNQTILGKTPCEVDVPVDVPERLGVRLFGPRFEDWVSEVRRDPSGEVSIEAKLERRAR